MTEVDQHTFLTALPDGKSSKSIVQNDEDNDDEEDHNNSQCSSPLNDESEQILNNKNTEELSSPSLQILVNDTAQENISHHDSSPNPPLGERLQTAFTRSVFHYATRIYENSEGPQQNKLNHDMAVILGSGDPPPGFGFLQPRIYHLTQKRPLPLEPLQVWRGYNGHVYFLPIQVQHLQADRAISPTKPRKPTTAPATASPTRKLERSRTLTTAFRNREPTANKSVRRKESSDKQRPQTQGKASVPAVSDGNEFIDNTRTTFTDGDDHPSDNKEPQTSTMWQSVVTCMPAPKKPISKRSQHDLEHLRTLKQQQQQSQDPLGSNRPVLPNIRLVPKTKFLYRGLAYKEMRKIPGMNNNDSDDENNANSLQRPLVDYGRSQVYARHEVNVARTKHPNPRQPPPTAASSSPYINDQQGTRSQTVLDIRETRRRIMKGTTAAHHPAARRPGRPENRSMLPSEVLLPSRGFSTISNMHIPISHVYTTPLQHHPTEPTSPLASQNFDVPSVDNNINVLTLQNIDQLPPTPKTPNPNPTPQIASSDTSLLTKYVQRPRSVTRRTPTAELLVDV